jgi:hypothetical protein
MPSLDTKRFDSSTPAPIFTRPPEALLAKPWEELTPEDQATLDAYIREVLAHLSLL